MRFALFGMSLALLGCSGQPTTVAVTLTIAAASNLAGVMEQLAPEFEKQTGVRIVVSYGSTSQLAHQIEHGAPFDVFAAADTEHVDALIDSGRLQRASRAVYARGELVLWVPDANPRIRKIADLVGPDVRFLALAQPDLAPYGRAAVEALKAAGIWEEAQPKITYASNISMARQYATSGNADAAFTARSLVMKDSGTVLTIDPKSYRPIDQALAISATSRHQDAARQFTAFLLGSSGREVFSRNGYSLPGQGPNAPPEID